MARYGIALAIGASSYVEVEANSPEAAVNLAYASEKASPSLCHQCTRDVEVTEAYEATIDTVDGQEYTGPQPDKGGAE